MVRVGRGWDAPSWCRLGVTPIAGIDLSDTESDYWLGMMWPDNPANASLDRGR
jgi:hypothetical protein